MLLKQMVLATFLEPKSTFAKKDAPDCGHRNIVIKKLLWPMGFDQNVSLANGSGNIFGPQIHSWQQKLSLIHILTLPTICSV